MNLKSVILDNLTNRNKSDLYANGNGYINHYRYYSAIFETIPNRLTIDELDVVKVRAYVNKEYASEIVNQNFAQNYAYKTKKIQFEDQYIVLKNNLVINIYEEAVYLLFANDIAEFANEFLLKLVPFKKKVKTSKTKDISLIIKGSYGLDTRELKVKKPSLNIDLHYNDDFKVVSANIITNIKKSKTQGLYLFHGQPGTGKSTYIKHLIHQQTKKVIFMPPNMAGNLDSMELTEFLIDNPNCVLSLKMPKI